MLSSKKLIQMAKKSQRIAMLGRRRLALERRLSQHDTDQCSSTQAEKGHFVVYTIDRKRFKIPLDYLNSKFVMVLFKLSELEFGHSVRPITLPCEAEFMEYAIDLVKRGMSEEVETALLSSISLPCHQACYAESTFERINQQVEVYGF